MAKQAVGTRAVVRTIMAGAWEHCAGRGASDDCPGEIRFAARNRSRAQVICNVYVDGVWDRVEHFHHECYLLAGEPHGPALS